ncbi:MAG: hypothetical protein AUH25_04930 [Thaumarchaeota archaeon 13_1_40CM_38_12]|nr:MAG: hypothetical protein AUH25_04930 [Thaumarchaeota archaeon 13_1_40CM_38_12]
MGNDLLKPIDAWTEVIICDPLTNHIAKGLSKIRGIHPLHITAVSQFLKLLAATIYFLSPSPLILPPIIFFLGILVDSMDGKIARLTGKSIKLHGTLDFISDQVSNSIYFLSLLLVLRSNEQFFLWLLIWYIIMFINGSLASTRYRLLSSLGGVNTDNSVELRDKYEDALPSILKGEFLRKMYISYMNLVDKAGKHRIYPHPTGVDSELVLFVIFPILVSVGGESAFPVLLLSVFFLFPETIYFGVICMALTKYWGSKSDARV